MALKNKDSFKAGELKASFNIKSGTNKEEFDQFPDYMKEAFAEGEMDGDGKIKLPKEVGKRIQRKMILDKEVSKKWE
jgi:hypothetical protein